jgi:hypothetical protein
VARLARLVATAALGLLLIGGFIPGREWPGVPLGRSGNIVVPVNGQTVVIPLAVVWLLPVAVAALLLARSSTGRTLVRRIAESRAHLAVCVLAAPLSPLILPPQSPDCRPGQNPSGCAKSETASAAVVMSLPFNVTSDRFAVHQTLSVEDRSRDVQP